jgi:hypothetical protein
LNVQATATDADVPTNVLTFELVAGPSGLTVSPSGDISWTPAEDQGPGTNVVTVKVFDNGTPSLSVTQNFTVVVNEVNLPPVFDAIESRMIHQGMSVSIAITATDADLPANLLSYTLLSAPLGAEFNSTNGLFTWTPDLDQVNSTNLIAGVVTDDGVPGLSATNSFTISVVSAPVIESINLVSNVVEIVWSSISGVSYRLEYKTNLDDLEWIILPGDVTASGETAAKTDVLAEDEERYYRVRVLP